MGTDLVLLFIRALMYSVVFVRVLESATRQCGGSGELRSRKEIPSLRVSLFCF